MVVVPLSKPAKNSGEAPRACGPQSLSWVSMVAAGTLAAGGALLVSGQRRAGLVTAATGTALAMLDQQETVRTWWNALPAYLAETQDMLARVQAVLDDIAAQRERLHKILAK
ncbi:MAG: hypothetical protein WBE38_14905 [Terracidiphilus sp.]|jgi:hypothetical protein